MPTPIKVYNPDGSISSIPSRWAICGSCQGDGSSSRYLGAFTSDDMADLGPEFFEDYARGVYDRECDECEGSGKVLEIDLDRATSEQILAYERSGEALAELRVMEAAERRMGC